MKKVDDNYEIRLKSGETIEATLPKPVAVPPAPAGWPNRWSSNSPSGSHLKVLVTGVYPGAPELIDHGKAFFLSGLDPGRVLCYAMSVTDNTTWLRDYAETGSEQAFGQLVARHFDLVHATALRMVCGDTQLAQDIAQTVFTDLARQARNLPRNLVLGGWLYRHTWFTATKAIRAERRRRMRESRAVEMKEQNESPDEVWQQIAPVLEEAMGRLLISHLHRLHYQHQNKTAPVADCSGS